MKQGQRLTFCGVGAHHQNGRAEKRIRDIQDLARTSLIHANLRWPDAVDARLWPYAIRHANESLNRTVFPGKNETPLESFSQTKVMPSMKDSRPFGCPAYVLDGRLQSGDKIGKWASRSRLAIYLGHSSQHARSVALVLSLTTGLVSPQYHVRFDYTFETIRNDRYQPRSCWQVQCGFEVPNIPPPGLLPRHLPTVSTIPHTEFEDIGDLNINDMEIENSEVPTVPTVATVNDRVTESERASETARGDVLQHNHSPTNPISTRSGRRVQAPARYNDYVAYESWVQNTDDRDSEIQYEHPLALATSSDPDVMYLQQALKEPDRVEFIKAMEKEVRSHTENSNWKIIKRGSVPKEHTVLPAVWAMRRKRDIATQQVYKWKARLNVHGGKQTKGLNYWETYAPVAAWSSIRLIMNAAALHGWKTHQLDFVLAFPQAPVETDIYMKFLLVLI
jgi:Reverse transcriptase (RNA-dependent DNA polymerase)